MRPKLFQFILSAALFFFILPNQVLATQKLVVAFSEFPPYKIVEKGKASGIDLDILKEIGTRMDFEVSPRFGTFEECLAMMKQGQADLMTSLLFRSEREPYILYVQPRYLTKSDKVFYVMKGSENLIRQFEDLRPLKIGVKAGVSYEQSFDADKELNKVAAQSIRENISKLLAGQIDTFLDADTEGDYWIKKSNLHYRIVKARFRFQQLDPVYMGISRKSSFKDQAKSFGRNLKYLVDHGVVQRLVEKYTK